MDTVVCMAAATGTGTAPTAWATAWGVADGVCFCKMNLIVLEAVP